MTSAATDPGAVGRTQLRSTDPPETAFWKIKAAAWTRRALTALLFAFVVAAVFSVFGVKSATVSSRGDGYVLTVKYAKVTRAGLQTPWQVTVARAGGFDGPIEIRTTGGFLDLFDANSFAAEPDAVRRDSRYFVLQFDQPVGDEIVVNFDARLSPSVQRGRSATTELLIHGRPVASVQYRMNVMP